MHKIRISSLTPGTKAGKIELEKALRESTPPQAAILNFNHVTTDHSILHYATFLLNRESIPNGFRDICIRVYLGHDFHLLISRYVIRHVTI